MRALLAKALCAFVVATLCATAVSQPTLVSTPVPGKLGYQPGSYFCEAIVVPATATAYLSGQTGGNSTDFRAQVKKAMDGLNGTLTGLGSSMNAVVKTTVYMTNIDLFADMNAVYTTYFTPKTLPSRSTVEIDFIAADPVFATMKASS